MEVKEAIEFIERYRYARNSKTDEIIDLLKSLEAENKKLKKENKALRKDKWELEGINEACRKENEAYKGMWRRLYEEIGNHGWELRDQDGFEIMTKIIKELEQKYLGGKEAQNDKSRR